MYDDAHHRTIYNEKKIGSNLKHSTRRKMAKYGASYKETWCSHEAEAEEISRYI